MPEPSSTTAFVGRRGELAVFERAVDVARRGGPAVLLVGGDAGIGKSTLVTEGARRAGVDLFVGRCVPMGGEVIPLAPLAELLRDVRRSKPDALSAPRWACCGTGSCRMRRWPREACRRARCSVRCSSWSGRSRATA